MWIRSESTGGALPTGQVRTPPPPPHLRYSYRGVGRGRGGGRGGRSTPLFGGKFYTFPTESVRAEISAKITLLKINI